MDTRNYPAWVTTESERAMHDDFRLFLAFIWMSLGLPEPTAAQYDIALWLQYGPRRRMVEAFRGVGKSWITAAFVLWLLWRDPQLKIMVTSASGTRADSFSIFVKQLINTIPLLNFLKPRPGQREANDGFDVGPATPDQSPSVKSVGITGQLTGSRADYIIPDDIEVPKNSATEQQREKIGELIKEFDAVLKPDGHIIYLGTPQTAQSIYNRLPARGYVIRVWTARYTTGLDSQGNDKYEGRLAPSQMRALAADPSLLNHSTEPSRFSDIDLAEREASYGRSGFDLQFMLDTSLSDANRYPLKLRDLIVMDCDPSIAPVQLSWASNPELAWKLENVGLNGDRLHRPMFASKEFAKYQGSVIVIDPAGRGKDETAYCVAKMLNGWIYITAWSGLQGGYSPAVLQKLADVAKEQKVNLVLVEENFGGGMFLALLQPYLAKTHQCSTEEFRVTGQKERRILDKLEPAVQQHRVVIDRAVIERDVAPEGGPQYSGQFQMAHLTRDRGSLAQDDRVDCLAEAVGYWTENLARDTDKAESAHKTKMLEAELAKFMKSVTGTTPGGTKWADITQ